MTLLADRRIAGDSAPNPVHRVGPGGNDGAKAQGAPTAIPLEQIESEICTLAGQIAAATSRYLSLLAEFDARQGWAGWNVRSCAQWLSWRCGLDLRTAREHLSVARRLSALPQLQVAFAAGRLSYSKVRAISRVAVPENEAGLVEGALHATASQIDRLTRGMRTAMDQPAPGQPPSIAPARLGVRWRWDDQGCLVLWGRLEADEGARLLAGATRANTLRNQARPDSDAHRAASGRAAPSQSTAGDRDGSAEPPTDHPQVLASAPSDLAPALVAMAEIACSEVEAPIFAAAAEVWIHVDAATLVAAEAASQESARNPDSGNPTKPARLDEGPALSEALLSMLACNAWLRRAVRGADDRITNLGRRLRRPSRKQYAALFFRDRGCAVPGCTRNRFMHAHHVVAWSQSGATSMDNLILLCGDHHRALHRGEFHVRALGRDRFQFLGPSGARYASAPPVRGTHRDLADRFSSVGPATIEPDWQGDPLDLDWAVACYLEQAQPRVQVEQASEMSIVDSSAVSEDSRFPM